MKGTNKRNILISVKFNTEDKEENIKAEKAMFQDLMVLAAKWRVEGLIDRYVIGDDEYIIHKV